MDAKDVAKFLVILVLFGVFAPIAGIWLRGKARWQAAIFAMICFMTIGGLFGPAEWGLTLGSVEWYRGHAKGYSFYFNEVLALALALSLWRESPKTFRWMPPGLWLYLLYTGLSMVSIINAPMQGYVWMVALKWVKASILFIAVYNFVRQEEHLAFFLKVMAIALCWEFIIVLKFKYLDHIYQVRGTFEHQNPLAMYATMVGVLFLAAGMGPKVCNGNLLLVAFVACAGTVQSTLSRAGLLFFAFGTSMVIGLSLLDKPTKRRLLTVGALGLVGMLGLILTINTIVARFHDEGNEASGETRVVMNAASKEMVHAHPLGIGWNNFALVINPPFPYGDVIDDRERELGHKVDPDYAKGVVESHYYLLMSETGWQGLASYLLLIAVFLWWNLRGMWRFRQHFLGCVSLGIGAGCFCNYVQSTLERALTQPRNMMLWLLLLAITARIETWRRTWPREGRI